MQQVVLKRDELATTPVDIGGRDIVIGFNEPRIKKSNKDIDTPDLDSKLNARLPAYFLPAVDIAHKQNNRPILYIVSGIVAALKWNSNTDRQKKLLVMNHSLKKDFLEHFFETFYPNTFSIVDCITMQDPLKIEEKKLLKLWEKIKERYPNDIEEIEEVLKRYSKSETDEESISDGIKYAVSHIFGMGDLNFEGNYIHNPVGYASIGGEKELLFNKVRLYAVDVLKEHAEEFFGRSVEAKDNISIIVKNNHNVPPPYSGSTISKHGVREIDEVTYENNRQLNYYETHKKLHEDIEYIYNHVGKDEYQTFWNEYKPRYEDLKARYIEAYNIANT